MKCEKCGNKRHVYIQDKGWVRCSCLDEIRAKRIMRDSMFPIPLQNLESSSFKMTTPKKKELGEALLKQLKNFDPKPFFIYSMSTEKEKVAAILTRYLIKQHKEFTSARYISLEDMTESFFKRQQEEEDVVPVEEVSILTLSIGKEITNMAHRTILFNLLYSRILNERFTIVISSIPRLRLRAQYLEKVDDLFTQNFKFFEC